VAAERPRSLDEQLEIERDRRRRVVASLLYGAEARPSTMPPGAWGPLLAGLTIAAFIALVFGVATLIRGSIGTQQTPGAHPSPTVSSR
jgi:hypothetical protein